MVPVARSHRSERRAEGITSCAPARMAATPISSGPSPVWPRFNLDQCEANRRHDRQMSPGNLTINGKTGPVMLAVEFAGAGTNPMNKKENRGFPCARRDGSHPLGHRLRHPFGGARMSNSPSAPPLKSNNQPRKSARQHSGNRPSDIPCACPIATISMISSRLAKGSPPLPRVRLHRPGGGLRTDQGAQYVGVRSCRSGARCSWRGGRDRYVLHHPRAQIRTAADAIVAHRGAARLSLGRAKQRSRMRRRNSACGFGISSLAKRAASRRFAALTSAPSCFSCMFHKDKGLNTHMIERCQAAGFDALALTVDTIVSGKRERCLRSGFTTPPRFRPPPAYWSYATRPRWTLDLPPARKIPPPQPRYPCDRGHQQGGEHRRIFQTRCSIPRWIGARRRRIREQWGGTFVLKGVMSAGDAVRAVEIRADAIMISNHGGRQLERQPCPFRPAARNRRCGGRQDRDHLRRRGAARHPLC